jgi:hypothetical protein
MPLTHAIAHPLPLAGEGYEVREFSPSPVGGISND